MEATAQINFGAKRLYGILHFPAPAAEIHRLVCMVVGGPQTRTGSHRLYVQIARALCQQGHVVFRFDYEGLGDSEGEFVGYEQAGPSIRSALDYLFGRLPALREVILWSLCDGATACIRYAPSDSRISAMILCNPYVHTKISQARTMLKHYYVRRVLEKDFWQKVLAFRFEAKQSFLSFASLVRTASASKNGKNTSAAISSKEIFPEEIVDGLCRFRKPLRLLLSTNDLTAREFQSLLQNRRELKRPQQRRQITVRFIKDADHTFSSRLFKSRVIEQTLMALDEVSEATLPRANVDPAKKTCRQSRAECETLSSSN